MNTLPPDLDNCILGKTVGPFAEQLVYSLSGLLKLCNENRDEVATIMKKAFTDHGAEAPVFVDDYLNDDESEDPQPLPEPDPVIFTGNDTPKIIPPFPGTEVPSLIH